MNVNLEITIVEIVLIRICVPILVGFVISAFQRIRRLEAAITGKAEKFGVKRSEQ